MTNGGGVVSAGHHFSVFSLPCKKPLYFNAFSTSAALYARLLPMNCC